MPSVSGKQHRLMAAVATNPAVARKTKIPQSVGKEFMEADKGKKFKGGGEMKESKAMVKKEIGFMKKKGAPKSMILAGLIAPIPRESIISWSPSF